MRKRLAIVTGSSGSIGRAICLELLQVGYRCVGVDLRDSDNQGWEFRACDLAIVAQIESEFAALCAMFGAPDVLINCAGLARHRNFFEVTATDFDATFAVNARGVFFASQIVARQMMAANHPGVIINIESVGGFISTNDPAYGMSKAAVSLLTKAMARQLASARIRVNGVAPGLVHTPMSDGIPADVHARYLGNVPLGRMAEPAEIAKVVSFLAGDSASYVTGTTVHVNGGMY